MNAVSGACLPSAAISAGCVTTREPLGEAFLIVSVRMRNHVKRLEKFHVEAVHAYYD